MMQDYWVGSSNDKTNLYLYDPRFVHANQDKVFLFDVTENRMQTFPKQSMRNTLRRTSPTNQRSAVDAYVSWLRQDGEHFLRANASDLPPSHFEKLFDELTRERLIAEEQEKLDGRQLRNKNLLIDKHRKYIRKIGKKYKGIVEGGGGKHREAHCHNCNQDLNSREDYCCVECGWIVCDCGACGCGWKGLRS